MIFVTRKELKTISPITPQLPVYQIRYRQYNATVQIISGSNRADGSSSYCQTLISMRDIEDGLRQIPSLNQSLTPTLTIAATSITSRSSMPAEEVFSAFSKQPSLQDYTAAKARNPRRQILPTADLRVNPFQRSGVTKLHSQDSCNKHVSSQQSEAAKKKDWGFDLLGIIAIYAGVGGAGFALYENQLPSQDNNAQGVQLALHTSAVISFSYNEASVFRQ